jgi:parallel beta-helix repeat protein
MKKAHIGSIIIGLTSLLTCAAQAACIEVNGTNTPGDATATFVISQPGSYCVPNNITGESGKTGIRIDADSVTLDLGGFALLGVSGSLSGILINTHFYVAVRNGSITGRGVNGLDGNSAGGARLDDLRASANVFAGLVINSGSQVNNCVTELNGNAGIVTSNDVLITGCVSSANVADGFQVSSGCTLKSCLAYNNGAAGIQTEGLDTLTIIDCNAHSNTTRGIVGPKRSFITSSTVNDNRGGGISVGGASTVSNCNASGNTGVGISAGAGSAITGCTVSSNTKDGIQVSNLTRVEGNTCQSNGAGTGGDGAGVHATGNVNRVDGNMVTQNDRGIDIDGTGNFVVRNDASNNTTNFDIVAGNTNANVEAPGPNFVITVPWANFTH